MVESKQVKTVTQKVSDKNIIIQTEMKSNDSTPKPDNIAYNIILMCEHGERVREEEESRL